MSTPLKELVEVLGDVSVYKDEDFVQVMVDDNTVLFMELDFAKSLASVLKKASQSEFDYDDEI